MHLTFAFIFQGRFPLGFPVGGYKAEDKVSCLRTHIPGTQHIASGESHISDPAISSLTLFTTEPLPLLTNKV